MTNIKSIGVFCGASEGASPVYANAARELANVFAAANITLVYGGAKVGLMGVMADQMLSCGGNVIGVIPNSLIKNEIAHPNLTKLYEVDSMSERKNLLMELSDGFIMLPGGIGTLDEFFAMTTLAQIGLHNKPRGILNTADFYHDLIRFLDLAVVEKFWNQVNRDRVFIDENPRELVSSLLNYRAPLVSRWVELEKVEA